VHAIPIQCIVFAAIIKSGFQDDTMTDATTLTHISQCQALMDTSARSCMDTSIPSYFDRGSLYSLVVRGGYLIIALVEEEKSFIPFRPQGLIGLRVPQASVIH
jgi:hypothetical protein